MARAALFDDLIGAQHNRWGYGKADLLFAFCEATAEKLPAWQLENGDKCFSSDKSGKLQIFLSETYMLIIFVIL